MTGLVLLPTLVAGGHVEPETIEVSTSSSSNDLDIKPYCQALLRLATEKADEDSYEEFLVKSYDIYVEPAPQHLCDLHAILEYMKGLEDPNWMPIPKTLIVYTKKARNFLQLHPDILFVKDIWGYLSSEESQLSRLHSISHVAERLLLFFLIFRNEAAEAQKIIGLIELFTDIHRAAVKKFFYSKGADDRFRVFSTHKEQKMLQLKHDLADSPLVKGDILYSKDSDSYLSEDSTI